MDNFLFQAALKPALVEEIRHKSMIAYKPAADLPGQIIHMVDFQFHVVHPGKYLPGDAFPQQEFMQT